MQGDQIGERHSGKYRKSLKGKNQWLIYLHSTMNTLKAFHVEKTRLKSPSKKCKHVQNKI